MLEQDVYRLQDADSIRRLAHEHPWVTLMTSADSGLVVSHLPVILAEEPDLVFLGHLPVVDARQHDIGKGQSVVVFQAEHGYVSPSWYGASPYVPTWNYRVLHVFGRPEPLDAAATLDVLQKTVERFEPAAGGTWQLDDVEAFVQRLLPAVVGFRLVPTRVVAKAKLSQDKPVDVVRRIVTALDSDGTYQNKQLAAAMRLAVPECSTAAMGAS